MTDIEITRLCAEAMGEKIVYPDDDNERLPLATENERGANLYDPLHDDAQAMALVKRFTLHAVYEAADRVWHCVTLQHGFYGRSPELNRAICECVAQMQAGKAG